jgi:hypothetical protein
MLKTYSITPAASAMTEVHGPHNGSHVNEAGPLTLCIAWAAAIMAHTVAREVPGLRVTSEKDRTTSPEHPYTQ